MPKSSVAALQVGSSVGGEEGNINNPQGAEYHSLRGHMDKLHWDADGSDSPNPSMTTAVHHEKEASVLPVVVDDNDDEEYAAIDNPNGINHHHIRNKTVSVDDNDLSHDSSGGQALAATASNVTTTNSTNNNATTSFLHNKTTIIPRNQSPHITLPNYDEYQKLIAAQEEEELEENNAASLLHTKQSQEQNAENLLENTPIRWDPPSDYFNNNGGASTEETDIMVGSTTSSSSSSSPRDPEGSDGIESSITSSAENSKVYCKSQNGVFGSPRNGGVVLRYQYELTVDRRLGEEWIDDILPNLEGGISDSLLPVLFEDECIPSENFRSRRRRRGREERVLLSTLRGGDHDDVASPANLRGGEGARRLSTSSSSSSRRRLEVIVGVDSDPRDFPARDKGEFSTHETGCVFSGFPLLAFYRCVNGLLL
jgi:hypothetical protein